MGTNNYIFLLLIRCIRCRLLTKTFQVLRVLESPQAAADAVAGFFLLWWLELVNSSLLVISLTCFFLVRNFPWTIAFYWLFPLHSFCKEYLASNYFINSSVISILFFACAAGWRVCVPQGSEWSFLAWVGIQRKGSGRHGCNLHKFYWFGKVCISPQNWACGH